MWAVKPLLGCLLSTAVGCNAASHFCMYVYFTLQKFQQTAVELDISVRLSVLMQNLDNHWMDFHKIWY
jgi:hypothetical protein